jgi:ribosomal protein S18 acetylase RimI-like enzyme
VVKQLFQGKELIAKRLTMRCFGVVVDGEVVSSTDLYLRGVDAQIEDVGTLPEHRGRGYASAVVLAAVEEARHAGSELIFLFADAEDWPKELYRRLGFDELGHYVKLLAP